MDKKKPNGFIAKIKDYLGLNRHSQETAYEQGPTWPKINFWEEMAGLEKALREANETLQGVAKIVSAASEKQEKTNQGWYKLNQGLKEALACTRQAEEGIAKATESMKKAAEKSRDTYNFIQLATTKPKGEA